MSKACRPVSVLVVVYADDAQILLLRRSKPLDSWQSVTGSLNDEESHTAAAARELLEETGLTDEGEFKYSDVSRRFEIDPRWRDQFEPGVVENEEFEWRYRLPAPRDIELNSDEHSEYQWLQIDDAIEAVWSWTNRDALIELREDLA
jgi:dATP pyrophosphohydrolase